MQLASSPLPFLRRLAFNMAVAAAVLAVALAVVCGVLMTLDNSGRTVSMALVWLTSPSVAPIFATVAVIVLAALVSNASRSAR